MKKLTLTIVFGLITINLIDTTAYTAPPLAIPMNLKTITGCS